jgi:hypothetical protein
MRFRDRFRRGRRERSPGGSRIYRHTHFEPIRKAAGSRKLEHGTDALLGVFDEQQHPVVLGPPRQSCV